MKSAEETKTPSMGSIEHMEIHPAANGGHVVTHHMKAKPMHSKGSIGMQYHEPEKHVFGEGEGHEMLAHVANHLNIKEMHEEESDEKDNDDGVGEDGEYD